jgi:hypothetical protein
VLGWSWLIIAFPAIAFALIVFFGLSSPRFSAGACISSIAGSLGYGALVASRVLWGPMRAEPG